MKFKIAAQKNVFDDHFLDIIGSEFKFDHAKGLAEWIKNSVDAYNREPVKYPDDDQVIFIRLSPKTPVNPIIFECVDFVGMTHDDIEAAFKRWGDPTAASRGKGKKFLGGHGNGGKFYMRQMFKESEFITYRNGKLNVFGFNEDKRYGFDPKYEDRAVKLPRALEIANLEALVSELPKVVRKRLETGKCGFTVVIGEAPDKVKRKNAPRSILQRLCVHPQARRLIKIKPVTAVISGSPPFRLTTEKIPPRAGFEGPYEFPVPKTLVAGGQEIELANKDFSAGKLRLFTSAEPFNRFGDKSTLNCIDILGDIGVIGSYRMNELGRIRNYAESEFIYGECTCPILEDPKDDCVRNDREKLTPSEKVDGLLGWICDKINDLADQMSAQTANQQHAEELKKSSFFNDFLNDWMRKTRFWEKLQGELFGGPGEGNSFGGTSEGGGGAGEEGDGIPSGGEGRTGEDDKNAGGAGDEKRKGPKYPRVLLSNFDADPLNLGPTVTFDPRHPLVYQRAQDVPEGIFWINTQAPFAKKIVDSPEYGHESSRWREYMFQRHIDILLKQAIYELNRREGDLIPEVLEERFDRLSQRAYEAAAQDPSLQSFLFDSRIDNDSTISSKNPSNA